MCTPPEKDIGAYAFPSICSRDFHDRFIIVDNSVVYHLGASLKDLGKKCFAIAVIEEAESLLEKIRLLQ